MSQRRPTYDYRYSIIPGGAVTDPNVSMRDLQVLALLGRHTDKKGWCWRSQVDMAEELRCGRATISRSILRLVKAGWLEREALPRGNAVPNLAEGEQPFSAFRYRVKIDRDDEDDPSTGEVPNNGHPPSDVPENGQGVPTNSGQGVPTQMGTLNRRTPFKDPTSTTRAREPEDWWDEFRTTVAKTWPGGFPPDNEVAGRLQFDLATTEHDPPLVVACARLHGHAKAEQNSKRGGLGTVAMRKPSNWLRDGDWKGYIPLAQAEIAAEEQAALALARVQAALGAGFIDLLRLRGLPDTRIADFDGMTLDAGPPPQLIATKGIQTILLQRYQAALQALYGEDLRIVPPPVRRAAS